MKSEIIRLDLGIVNAYLIKTDDEFVLVDAGGFTSWYKKPDNRRDLLEIELKKNYCDQKNLKLLILTHGDCDHVANSKYLRYKYKLKIGMHIADLKLVESLDLKMLMSASNFESKILKLVFKLKKNKFEKNNLEILKVFENFTPDIYIDERSDLKDYGLYAKVLHIPGHTDGSIGILFESGDFICGDIFANMIKPGYSPNAKNFSELKETCNKLKSLNIKRVYPGHGKPFDFKELKL